MAIQVEHTDTFGGEANYSWVRRYSIEGDNLTDLQLVRRAKKLTGFNGCRARVEQWGDDTIAIYPQGCSQVVFISFVEE